MDEQSRVTIHMLFTSVADRDHVIREYNAIEGDKQTLDRLAAYLAKFFLPDQAFTKKKS